MTHKPYPITDHTPRQALIFRMQAYVYSNVQMRHNRKADDAAGQVLARFDHMLDANPTDNGGYWSGYYFDLFVRECQSWG